MAGTPWKPVKCAQGKRGQYGGKETLFLRLAHTADLYPDYGAGVCASGELRKPVHKTGDRGSGIYQEQVVKNAAALAAALKKQGFNILTGGTDNHLMLVDLRGMDVSGKELQNRCDQVYITLNKNTVPNDPRSPFVTSGVRIGTPAVTSRGLKEEDMEKIAECIWLAATDFEAKADYIRGEVDKICGKYPLYQ